MKCSIMVEVEFVKLTVYYDGSISEAWLAVLLLNIL